MKRKRVSVPPEQNAALASVVSRVTKSVTLEKKTSRDENWLAWLALVQNAFAVKDVDD